MQIKLIGGTALASISHQQSDWLRVGAAALHSTLPIMQWQVVIPESYSFDDSKSILWWQPNLCFLLKLLGMLIVPCSVSCETEDWDCEMHQEHIIRGRSSLRLGMWLEHSSHIPFCSLCMPLGYLVQWKPRPKMAIPSVKAVHIRRPHLRGPHWQ